MARVELATETRRTSRKKLRRELARVLNAYSLENESNTPDFVLAEYLLKCLDAWNVASRAREAWYGRDGECHVTALAITRGARNAPAKKRKK